MGSEMCIRDSIKSVMVYLMVPTTWITVVILELIHAGRPDFGRVVFIRYRTNPGLPGFVMIHNNRANRMAYAGDKSFKFLTYQLPTVGYWPTVAMTGNGELGFDSGEGA